MKLNIVVGLCALLSFTSFSKEYLVTVKDESAFHKNSLLNHGITNVQKSAKIGDKQVYKVTASNNLLDVSNTLYDSGFTHIEENIEYSVSSLVNDEKFNVQWGLSNKGNNEPRRGGGRIPIPGVTGADSNILPAWEITKGSKDIVIAVIDTGVDYKHPDLIDNMWTNKAELNGRPGIDDDGNGYVDDIYGYDFYNNDNDPMDDNHHGTHVAGIIGASHNSIGIAGVMGKVSLMALKFADKKGRGDLDKALRAVEYAIEKNVHVMNNSWGSLRKSSLLEDAIREANKKNIVFLAASGNSYRDNDLYPRYPANYEVDNVIAVAAYNPENRLTGFSCYGQETVHVAAPGRNIVSTIPNGKYKVLSGTSMAAPFVAGAVGLYQSLYGRVSPLAIRNLLIESSAAVDHLSDKVTSGGRVDIGNLIKKEAL